MIPRYLSPLRYPGGKGKMAGKLAGLFAAQSTAMELEIWVEPFAGGAGAGLGMLEIGACEEIWLTEKHPALAAFWEAVVRDGERFACDVEQLAPTLSLFADARERIADPSPADRYRVALDAFVVNRCSRSGILHPSAGPIGGWAQNGKHKVTDRWNGGSLADRIRRVHEHGRRGRIRVTHGDAIDAISELAGSGIEEECFLFVDPPYLREGNRLYREGMTDGLHEQLAAALADCPSPWLLTYDDEPAVTERLYPAYRALAYRIANSANRRRDAWEYAVLSDRVDVRALDRGAGVAPALLEGRESRWVRR